MYLLIRLPLFLVIAVFVLYALDDFFSQLIQAWPVTLVLLFLLLALVSPGAYAAWKKARAAKQEGIDGQA